MQRIKVIVNPISGRGSGEKSYPLIQHCLDQSGLNFEMCRTSSPGHAIQLAEDASSEGYDIVVAVGGDGTANEVLNGLVNARQKGSGRAVFGLISVGRGNDFGFGIDTPISLEEACQAIARDRRKWIDVGWVKGGDYPEGRYFGNGVGVGFDAVVGFEALKLKRLSGFPSYIVAALKTIFLYFRAPTVRVEYDGEMLDLSALMVSTMNGRRLGGGFMMAPEGKIDDGLFDLCIAGEVSKLGIFALIPRFMQGTQASHPAIHTAQAAQVTITALQGALPAHADGETLCYAGDHLVIKIIPKALEVIVP